MKKKLLLLVIVSFSFTLVSASIITNTNQSTQFIRMLSRNASTDIDAVYYNPAGLLKLADGFHLAVHNQTFSQEKEVTSQYPLLNQAKYIGEVNVPFFPNLYAVYKKDKLALSFGFGPNAGGGSADFTTGLPSFETSIAGLPALISGLGIPTAAYSADIAFNGSSIYLGFQLNASYALSDMLQVAVGARYISATNTYEGSIKNIQINPVHPLINPTGGMMSAVSFFTAIGQTAYAAMVGNKIVDAKQTGSAITPLLSVNITPVDGLNISLKYEFNTKLEVKNQTTNDDVGMFPDGEVTPSDIPAIFSFGAEYDIFKNFRVSVSVNYFFDKNANWDGRENLVDSNTYDAAIGFECNICDTFLVSAGYLRTQMNLIADYQTDISHELSSNAFGFGGQVKLPENLTIDFGGLIITYEEAEKTITDAIVGAYLEKYNRSNWGFTIGLGYHF